MIWQDHISWDTWRFGLGSRSWCPWSRRTCSMPRPNRRKGMGLPCHCIRSSSPSQSEKQLRKFGLFLAFTLFIWLYGQFLLVPPCTIHLVSTVFVSLEVNKLYSKTIFQREKLGPCFAIFQCAFLNNRKGKLFLEPKCLPVWWLCQPDPIAPPSRPSHWGCRPRRNPPWHSCPPSSSQTRSAPIPRSGGTSSRLWRCNHRSCIPSIQRLTKLNEE